MNNLKEKITNLPDAPGVYIFKDGLGKIIYIGKATSLKKRASSYFNRQLSAKTQNLVAKICDIEYIVTPSETKAQLLEASLIKDNQPYYNVSLKDDKSFPLVRITTEEFPVVSICRLKKQIAEDRSLYFGPFTDSVSLRQALKVIRKIFGFRSCRIMPKKACLYSRLKLCPAPCVGKINPREYQALIRQIRLFLESKYEEVIKDLIQKMQAASKTKNFEEAAKRRDQINALSVFAEGKELAGSVNEAQDLKILLGLDKVPQRIEGFDISNISGKEATGSMVSFYNGFPDKNNYRRFKVKTNLKIDDYGMIREIVRRRYQRLKEEIRQMPDLILIDGGKGHLQVALEEIRQLGLDLPIFSIAKEKEHIYTLAKAMPLKLKEGSPALNLIRRIRDEAHRFAVAYHHILRRKKILGE